MTIRLVAIDLDDTLLNGDLRITDRCKAAIDRTVQQGVVVTLATGRMLSSALPYAQELGVDVPLITYQGALVKNSRSHEILYFQPLPSRQAIEVLEYFAAQEVHFHTYFDDRLCMEKLTPEGRYYADLAGVEPVLVDSLTSAARTRAALKIMAVTRDKQQLLRMQTELKTGYQGSLYITQSKPCFLEVMNQKANKAAALKVVAKHYQVAQQEIMAIGDGYNDIEMLSFAGTGVAMGNAHPEIRKVADYVTCSNEEEGVAEALEKFILRREVR